MLSKCWTVIIFSIFDSISFVYRFRNEVAESFVVLYLFILGKSIMFSFDSYTISCSYPQCSWFSFFFKLSAIIIAIATILAVNCYIVVVLICSFLLISNIGHFFTYLSAIMCLKSVVHIWTGLHYPYWVLGVPYTFLKQTFSWHMISKYFVALYKFLFIISLIV